MMTDIWKRLSANWSLLCVALVVGVVYLWTLQREIVGICSFDYCADIGEFQVALPLWGTVHHTGYPLYMMIGSPFVVLLDFLGIPPAMGASLYSFVWQLAAVVFVVWLARRFTGNDLAAVGVGLVFALIEPIWMHGVIAEVYSLSMLFSALILYLAFDLEKNWSNKRGWFLAFVCGLAVFHHRLLIFLIFWVGIYLLPTAWRAGSFWRWLAIAVPWAALGFLPYLDIPLRMWLGSVWTYSQENTWEEFWHVFNAQEEAERQLQMIDSPVSFLAAAQDVFQTFMADLTLPGALLVAVAALQFFWRRNNWLFWCLLGAIATYMLFPMLMPRLRLTQQSLMFAYLASMLLAAAGVGMLRPAWRYLAAGLLVAWAIGLAALNWSFITTITNDRSGVYYTAAAENLDAPPGSVIMAPWGSVYFMLAYAHLVEGRMAEWEIVDHRADFRTLTQNGTLPIYTHASTLYLFGADWWGQYIDAPLRVSSAGPNMVKLATDPFPSAPETGEALGDHIALVDWEARPFADDELHVTLYWTAAETPTGSYSTFVHVSDQEAITGPDDILAQSDYHVPVYGRYPTVEWVPGELVREDHLLEIPADRAPRTIVVGMYWQEEDGSFHQLGTFSLPYSLPASSSPAPSSSSLLPVPAEFVDRASRMPFTLDAID